MDSQKEHTVNVSLLNSRVHFVFSVYCVLFLFNFISTVSKQSNSVRLILAFNLHETIVYPQYVAYRVSKSSYFDQITPNT